MKKLILYLINLYERTPLGCHKLCKYYPTCSKYAKEAIGTYGILKGGILSLKRILKCNPLSKGGIDLVPKNEPKCKVKTSQNVK